MPTNAILTKGDIQTNQVISIEAADINHPMSLAGMSTEVEILADISATNSVVERKQGMSDKVSEAKSELFLDQLRLDVTGIIILMVGRMRDVSADTGQYLSTDFVVSDAKGNMIHCSAKATVEYNFIRLKVGSIYSVKIFVVKPNKEEYRILKNDTYMIEFDGSMTIRKVLVKADGFLRYLFQLQDLDGIEPSDNKYLIGELLLL
ncbi:reverse transcriptase domain-containing protein [Tanacetum coccineum]